MCVSHGDAYLSIKGFSFDTCKTRTGTLNNETVKKNDPHEICVRKLEYKRVVKNGTRGDGGLMGHGDGWTS